jgi:HEAT repeat protein
MEFVTVGDLELALDDPDPFVRRRAAEDVGHLTDLTLAPALIGALADEDPTVAEVACWAAGELERNDDPTIASLIAIATEHADALCREAAVAALGAIGDQRGRSAVLVACTDIATVRRRAVLALAAFDGTECIDALRALTADRDLQVRQSAEDLLAIVEGQSIGGTSGS